MSKELYEQTLLQLKTQGAFIETKDRVLLDYSTLLPDEGVENRTRDIRLRVTNGQPEIITKVGKWGGSEHRKEISVKTEKGSFDALVETYAVLGLKKAVLCVRHTEVFNYKDIEFALVTVPNHSYYFEAECMADADSDVDSVKSHIQTVCQGLGLSLFDDAGFYAYIETLNKEANEMFDYDSYTEGYFKNRFSL